MKEKYHVIINNNIVYDNLYIANTFYERFKGLMFNPRDKQYGLFIKSCNSIHTCFMKYNIDIICLDKNFKIIKIFYNLKPFKFIFPQKNVNHILEIPSDHIYHINIDDNIKIKKSCWYEKTDTNSFFI